jgi:5-methylcytosine-specific restriction endonuclease McrA
MPKRSKKPGNGYYVKILRKDLCVFCGKAGTDGGNTIDHIQPSSRRGLNCWINFAPACGKCNVQKSNLTLLEFLLIRQGMKRPKWGKNMTRYYDDDALVVAELPEKWYNPLFELLGVNVYP